MSSEQCDSSPNSDSSGSFSFCQMTESDYAKVIFCEIEDSYPLGEDISCVYQITESITPQASDYIGLFRVGWQCASECLVSHSCSDAYSAPTADGVCDCIVFRADNLPSDTTEFYQFLYLTVSDAVCGASTPFRFQVSKIVEPLPESNTTEDHPAEDLLISTLQMEKDFLHHTIQNMETEINNLKIKNQGMSYAYITLQEELKSLLAKKKESSSDIELTAPSFDAISLTDENQDLQKKSNDVEMERDRLKKMYIELRRANLQQYYDYHMKSALFLSKHSRSFDVEDFVISDEGKVAVAACDELFSVSYNPLFYAKHPNGKYIDLRNDGTMDSFLEAPSACNNDNSSMSAAKNFSGYNYGIQDIPPKDGALNINDGPRSFASNERDTKNNDLKDLKTNNSAVTPLDTDTLPFRKSAAKFEIQVATGAKNVIEPENSCSQIDTEKALEEKICLHGKKEVEFLHKMIQVATGAKNVIEPENSCSQIDTENAESSPLELMRNVIYKHIREHLNTYYKDVKNIQVATGTKNVIERENSCSQIDTEKAEEWKAKEMSLKSKIEDLTSRLNEAAGLYKKQYLEIKFLKKQLKKSDSCNKKNHSCAGVSNSSKQTCFSKLKDRLSDSDDSLLDPVENQPAVSSSSSDCDTGERVSRQDSGPKVTAYHSTYGLPPTYSNVTSSVTNSLVGMAPSENKAGVLTNTRPGVMTTSAVFPRSPSTSQSTSCSRAVGMSPYVGSRSITTTASEYGMPTIPIPTTTCSGIASVAGVSSYDELDLQYLINPYAGSEKPATESVLNYPGGISNLDYRVAPFSNITACDMAQRVCELPCPVCEKLINVFTENTDAMDDHLLNAHNQKLCPICGLMFDQSLPPDYFKFHVENHFVNENDQK